MSYSSFLKDCGGAASVAAFCWWLPAVLSSLCCLKSKPHLSLQLIGCYTVMLSSSVGFFSSAFACNYLLFTKGHQTIESEIGRQHESSRTLQPSLFFAGNSYLYSVLLLILTFSIKMSTFCQYSLNISCSSCPLIAEDIKVSSSLKPPPPKCSIFISVIQIYWASTSNYYPLTFMLLKGADVGL